MVRWEKMTRTRAKKANSKTGAGSHHSVRYSRFEGKRAGGVFEVYLGKQLMSYTMNPCVSKRGFSMLAVIVVLAIAAIGYWYYSDSKESKDQATAKNGEAQTISPAQEGWRVYQNDQYGLGFSFPPSWDSCSEDTFEADRQVEKVGKPALLTCFADPASKSLHAYVTATQATEAEYAAVRKYYTDVRADMEKNPEKYPGAIGHFWVKETTLGGEGALSVCRGDSMGLKCWIHIFENGNIISFSYGMLTYPADIKNTESMLASFELTK